MRFVATVGCAVLALVIIGAGCGGGGAGGSGGGAGSSGTTSTTTTTATDTGSTTSTGSTTGGSYSQAIKAADGGSFTAPGATVVIPAGALAADTTLTLTISDKAGQPDAGSIVANIYDFGPNGTTFSKPVSMTLDFSGPPPAGKTAQIAFLQGGAWVPLADSAITGTQVTATTTHFTPFTVVLVPGGQPTGQCSAITACGGDMVGTWTYTAGCLTLAAGSNPLLTTCPASKATATLDVTGTANIKSDGTYDTSGGTQTVSLVIDAPKSCFGGACPQSNPPYVWVDTGTACKGTMQQGPTPVTESGTYSTAGTTVTFNKTSPSTSTSTGDYCVKSATSMDVRLVDKDGNTMGYTLTK